MAVCLVLLGASLPASSQLLITEIMPDNTRTLADEDGQFPDWIEIHNPTAAPVNLQGWHLTDTPLLLTKWTFPAMMLEPGGFLVVFASGKDRVGDPLHTNFQLENGGEYLALVEPDGTTIASGFNPSYPPVKEDVSFGLSTRVVTRQLLANAAPRILVPTSAGELPADWKDPGFTPDAGWLTGFAPPALGFDTNQPPPIAVNLAPGGNAIQSTTSGNAAANLAINGSTADHTQTLNTDNAPFWQVTLAAEAALERIVLRNNPSCCGSRLRDITVEILNSDGTLTNFTSMLLNPENAGFTFPDGPALIELDLVALTGFSVPGRVVRVRRAPDADLSGSAGQGGSDEVSTLALAEVEVHGAPLGGDVQRVNLARTGTPSPTATQSTTLSGFTANLGINGNLGDFTHTAAGDPSPTWTLDLGRMAVIEEITLHNRDSCCGSRLRDITVRVLDEGNNVLYTSPLLNPENTGFSYPNGPDNLVIDLAASTVVGRKVTIHRTPDADLSGTGGQGNADEGSVLSLGEVIVLGYDLSSLRPYIRTDLESAMLGVNASAFVQLPFTAASPAELISLELGLRYNDGFVAYVNGVEVARRNAPLALAWDSAATVSRTLGETLAREAIDLDAARPLLQPGPNVLALHGLNIGAGDGDFLLQPELAASHLDVTANVYLVDATPGGLNQSEFYVDEVADTQFSVDRGFFSEAFALEITTPTPGAAVYYTLDCSEPDPATGLLYGGPITITNSSVVRARAFREGWLPTDVDTHTYLFLDDVIHQAADWPVTRVPPPNFPASWGGNAVDYGMDPTIVSQFTIEQWREALTQVPIMSVVTEMESLFDAATGIYANALQHGIDWERPASLELLDPGAAEAGRFQENCGLRIRGGFSRNPQFVKHSFRVFFRREYGAPKLNYPLFEDEGASEFDTFDLRTSQNYSWPREGTYSNGRHDTMVREVWCRATLGAMGQPHRRSRYYHLFLNGQYWGLYETDERPEASFGETYLGGSKEDYDVVKCANHVGGFVTEVTDGNFQSFSNLWTMARAVAADPSNANYFRVLGRNADGSRNPALPVMLEVDNLIDYMLGIFYSGDGDATLSSFLGNSQPNNWFGMKNRNNPDQGYIFVNSDAEHTLGAPSSQADRTGPFPHANQNGFTYANPQWIHEDLMRNAEYRLRFADRVQRHFFNGGALTFEACTNRWWGKAVQIERAVRAYSARWGDAVREPAYNEADWRFMVQFVATNFFPNRAGIVLGQLRADNLFPPVGAPGFNSHGGFVAPGSMLTMSQTNVAGTIYFTTDGTDPRLAGGALSPNAQVYAAPLPLTGNTHVRARVRVGTDWSPLIEATFTTAEYFGALAVTEIMYNPPDEPGVNGSELEFLELKNTGDSVLDLSGLLFDSGISFVFTNGTRLPAGAHFVLVANAGAFAARYPGVPIGGVYGGGLNNGGETLRLIHLIGGTVFSLAYDNAIPWPLAADGHGFSAVPLDPAANLNSDNGGHWRASAAAGGSPGADDPEPSIPGVVINEALTHTETGQDYIELHNPTQATADIGGWFLTDDPDQPRKFRIPDGASLVPGAHAVFHESDFNPVPGAPQSFTLNAQGDAVFLFSGEGAADLTGYSHGFEFGAAPEGISFGRHVISTGEDQFPLQMAPTPEGANSGPSIGPVVLREIHYHPAPGGDSFVELQNVSEAAVDLFDGSGTNMWRVNGLGFDFPPGVTLPPEGLALVVGIDPALFRGRYQVPAGVPIFGPWTGTLQNSGERLELQRPDPRGTNGVAQVTVDEVRYNDRAPWPVAADGNGPSLQKPDPSNYGNDPAHWRAAAPSPGGALGGGTAPSISLHPVDTDVVAYQSATLEGAATGSTPIFYQWRFAGAPIDGATGSVLTLTNVQPGQAGLYDLVAYNGAGSAASDPARLSVLIPANILQHPVSLMVMEGAPAMFSVNASSTSPISYQWRFNGQPLEGETNVTLVIPSATRERDGVYDVVVTDSIGDIVSAPAVLTVLVAPEVVDLSTNYWAVQGSDVMLSVRTAGTLPMSYRWRRGFGTLKIETLQAHESFLLIPNIQPTNTGPSNRYSIVLTNRASFMPGVLSSNILIHILADTDGDGLPDVWEQANGLDSGQPGDAEGDDDGDGVTNGDEYRSGTDPQDADSHLKVEAIEGVPGGAVLRFLAASNTTYTILAKDALELLVWEHLADVPAAPSNRVVELPDTSGVAKRFYRLVTPRQ